MPASWNRDTLPEGDEKRDAVRDMFDAIAPRYDLVNRIMTFRLDVRWRRRAVRALGLPPASTVLDLASGTGDLCVELARAGHRPISVDLSLGMLRADRSGAPRVQADILRLPVPDGSVDGVTCGFALRNLVDLRVVLRRARPGRAPRRAHRPARRRRARQPRSCGGATASTSARSCRGSAAGCPIPRPTATSRAASPTCPPPADMVAMLRDAGFADADAPRAERRHHPAAHRHPLMRAVTRARRRRRRPPRPQRRRRATTATCSSATVSASPAVASPPASPVDDAVGAAGLDRARRQDGGAACRARSPSGGCRSSPGEPGELVVPAIVLRKTADGRRFVTEIDGADESLPGSAAARSRRRGVHDRAGDAGRPLPRRRRRGTRRGPRRRG